MDSNFSFLQQEFLPLAATAQRAEAQVHTDPMYCAILCRKSLEEFVRWLYDNDADLTVPSDTTLNSLLHEPSFQALLPKGLFSQANLLRKIGNNAAHSSSLTTVRESLTAVKILHDVALWVVRLYSRSQTPAHSFQEELLPTGNLVERTRRQMEALSAEYGEAKAQLERANEELLRNTEKLATLENRLAAVQQVKQQNFELLLATPSVLSLTEAETRSLYIDVLLKEAGWDLAAPNVREFGLQHVDDPQSSRFADYVLWGDNGKPLGVVEAKRTTVDAYEGKRQAALYANALEKMYGQRPVIFYSNGYDTYIWDDEFYPPRPVQGFYSKEELQRLISRRSLRKKLTDAERNKDIAGRYYQEEAIRRVAESLEAGRRGALLVMATGSGKTRTAAAIVDLLTNCNWARRILFLADRNALVTQAKNNFNKYLPHLTAIDLTKEDPDTASRLVFSTYPTIMNRIDQTKVEGVRYFGVGHFDVVIIDEAHRSVYEKYRAVFDYFDAIFIGLTATPKAETERDTYELFQLETDNPTFAYELDKAVSDGYLRPPLGMPAPMKFPRQGVKYNELPPAEKAVYEREFLENYGAVPEEVSSSAVNTWLFNEDTVNKVLKLLMQKGLQIEGGDKLGKTIIFAKNHDHAVFIEECFDKLYPQHKGKMLKVVDNVSNDPQGLIDEFSDATKTDFQIAVSVDMLDTGIDIPEILNLVAFKPVRSKAKWWQMIGRGTRLRPGIFGPGLDKEHFYLFDICGNIEFFESDIKETEPRTSGTLSSRVFKAKLNTAYLLSDGTEEDKRIQQILLDELHSIVAGFSPDDFRVRMKLRYVDKYKQREQWNAMSQLDVLEIERELAPLYNDSRSTEAARRFDLLVLNYGLAVLNDKTIASRYKDMVQDTVKGLLKKTSIPSVKAKEGLINAVLEDEWWQVASHSTMNEARLGLRDLIQYLEPSKQQALYTNFTDEMGEVTMKEMVGSYRELGSYKRRVEKFIRENRNNLTIHRICTNKPITKSELVDLEKLLFSIDTSMSKEDFEKVTGQQPLAQFVRSILGLDINAAKEAFAGFLQNSRLNATQLHFINTIIDYLNVNGTIDKQMLFEKPFTDINDGGLAGVFEMEKAGVVVRIVDEINRNAVEVV